jgi:hypothetical protein
VSPPCVLFGTLAPISGSAAHPGEQLPPTEARRCVAAPRMQRRAKAQQAHGTGPARHGLMAPPPPVQTAHLGMPGLPACQPPPIVPALPQLQQASVQVALSRVHSHTRQSVRAAERCPPAARTRRAVEPSPCANERTRLHAALFTGGAA